MEKFIFGIMTYNHENYIIEHLESIKYLICSYGRDLSFKLVLADDGSKDKTVLLAKSWLQHNNSLFAEVVIIADGNNCGTCINYTNIWEHIDSPNFKITAGDDVYSYVDQFAIPSMSDSDYISGMPLLLVGKDILNSKSVIFHTIATKFIFKGRSFKDRLNEISVMNTPNLFYPLKFIRNKNVFDFIRRFKVTEDFPMMVKVSEEYISTDFQQLDEVLVYYRRTSGSAYLIREADFNNDKVVLFNHLISHEPSIWKKLLLKNRLWCYQSSNSILKKLLNLNYYIYFLRLFLNLPFILRSFCKLNTNLKGHQHHYDTIALSASRFLESRNS